MTALAGADTAEIEAQRRSPAAAESAGQGVHHLVVQRSAEKRMRVTDDRGIARREVRWLLDQRLEPARRAFNGGGGDGERAH